MPGFFRLALSAFFLMICFAAAGPAAFAAPGGLTVVDGPNGGRVVFGAVTGVSSVPDAMGAALRSLHSEFGAKPQVGRPFEVRGSGSSAVHFALQPPNGKPLAGMVIVTPTASSGFEAGIVFDFQDRIATSFNPLTQLLLQRWRPDERAAGGKAGAGSSGAPLASNAPQGLSGPVPPMRNFVLPDQTASVGLPEGWQVDRSSGGGTIIVNGPGGEFVCMGCPYSAIDNSTAQGRRVQQQSLGALRNTSYASMIYYPYGGASLGRTYVDLTRMQREKAHAAPAPIRLTGEQPIDARAGSRCSLLRGEIAPHDGQGPMSLDTVFCVGPPTQGMWLALAYQRSAPLAIADRQRATMAAITASFKENTPAIQRMANQIAAPAIAQIREIGRQATIRAAQADATRIEMRNSYQARSDVQDRASQGFSNYMRDQTTVVDLDHNTHETMWNQTADSLVRNDPKRYGYVDTPGFWKGVDY